MKHTMRFCILSIAIVLSQVPLAHADLDSDAEAIFNFAESEFSNYFSPPSTTQMFEEWRFRYYPAMDTYVGVSDSGVVGVLGDVFGGLFIVGSVEDVLAMIPNSSPGGASRELDPGTTECLNVGFPAAGRVASHTTTVVSGEGAGTSFGFTTTYLAADSTQSMTRTEQTTVVSGVTSSTVSETTIHYQVIGDYFYQTSVDTSASTTVFGFDTTTESTTTYDEPYFSHPVQPFCVGQSWFAAATGITTVSSYLGGSQTTTGHTIPTTTTVSAVNEVVSVPAGTFTTLKLTSIDHDGDSTIVDYIDVSSGIFVRGDSFDAAGNLLARTEVTSLN